MGKKKEKIKVSFLGHSNEDVTGSSVLIEYPKNKKEYGTILLELGLVQGEATFDKDISANRKMLDNIPKELVSNIEYVLVGHSHVDHVGNLPYLNSENGFNGKIIATNQAMAVAKDLIEDSVNIHAKNIEKLKAQGRKTRPLYTKQNMYEMFENMEGIPFNKRVDLNEQVIIEFIHSGHCFGGAMIKIWIRRPNNSIFHMIYTSDLGSEYNRIIHPLSDHREQISKCNLLVSEATYSNREKSFTKAEVVKEFEEFKATIKESILNKKRVLLPVFSFNKTQEFMILLYEWLKEEEWFGDTQIILDGVLMHKVSSSIANTIENKEYRDYFREVCNWKNFKVNKTYDGTISILSERTVGIYLASSGFIQNGRIVTYVQQFLGCSKDIIIFTGYIGGEGSIGERILNPNQKTVTIEKRTIMKRAEIKRFHCFSGHIQFEELMSLFKGMNCEKILIHHTPNEDKKQFLKETKEELQLIGKSTKIDCVTKNNNEFYF